MEIILNFFGSIVVLAIAIFLLYIAGRAFGRGVLKELDLLLGNKFKNQINKKSKENDNTETK
jgi:hypothetical protein